MAFALLGFLYDNYQKHAQINAVIYQNNKSGPVGLFEPTTSACFLDCYAYLKRTDRERNTVPGISKESSY